MIHQQEAFEFSGAGEVEGAGTRAEYEWTAGRGWLVTYSTDDGLRLGDSRHPLHPPLGLVRRDDEARLINVVADWLELLDFGDEAVAAAFAADALRH